MCFNQTGDISTLNGISLKLVDKFTYLGNSVSSIETDNNTRLAKAWAAINRLSVIWKSDLTDKMKCSFFQAAVVLIQLYGCTTWTVTKHIEKKHDSNYTRMLQAILNKSWRQHPIEQQVCSHLHHENYWRCPWCSRYRRRKWTRRYEFKSWTILIAFHIALIPLGKVWIQLFSLQLWVNSRTD